ncbi:MAG: flavin reductase [Lysobacteraceae bacterium]|nr:MAG: flavin reductase [Xanthomonadaceae bacterium]
MSMPAHDIEADIKARCDAFKAAMQRYPSGVVIATMRNRSDAPRGFTASSFTSLSLSPPMILLCLAKTADCHSDFCETERFAVNMLGHGHEALATRFATRGADKFADGAFVPGPCGLPVCRDALAWMICRRHALHGHGDHTILVADVESVELVRDDDAILWYRRQFAQVAPARLKPESSS